MATSGALVRRRRGAHGKVIAPNPREWPLLLVVAAGASAIVFARRPDALTRPQLWAEDGTFFLADAYNRGGVATLFHAHSGYLVLLNRSVALVAAHLPLAWAPALFGVAGLTCQVLPAVLLVAKRSAVLLPERWLRVLVATLYLALPNTYEVDVNLTNAQWHLALAAALIIVSRPVVSRAALAVDACVVVVAGLTGPFGLILFLPAGIMAAVRRTRRDTVVLGVALLTALAQLICVTHSPRPVPEPLGPSLHLLLRILGGQVVLVPLIGSRGYGALVARHPADVVFALATGIGIAAGAGVVARTGAEVRTLALFGSLVLVAALLDPLAGSGRSGWADLAHPGTAGRYFFVPVVAGLVGFAALARAAPRALLVPGIAALVAAAAVGIRLDWRYPAYVNLHYAAQIRHFEHLAHGARMVIPLNPLGWHMTLVRR